MIFVMKGGGTTTSERSLLRSSALSTKNLEVAISGLVEGEGSDVWMGPNSRWRSPRAYKMAYQAFFVTSQISPSAIKWTLSE